MKSIVDSGCAKREEEQMSCFWLAMEVFFICQWQHVHWETQAFNVRVYIDDWAGMAFGEGCMS